MQKALSECATMHRHMAVGVLALALAASAVALPSATPVVEAATACTNWKSTYSPPPTIRVLRSYGAAKGKVQVVSFRAYVENVMSWEWPSTYPTAALRAGAVAVKQYGWYYAIHWRGGATAGGVCYDVRDTSVDQIFQPETRAATVRQTSAVAATWNLTVRRTLDGKPGKFILTGYWPGTIATCGAEKNGFRLYQKGVKACASLGKTTEEIARIYYGATLQPTDPGRHNVVGALNGPGDGGVAVPNGDGVDAHVFQSTSTGFVAPWKADAIAIADASTLGRVSADVDGDGDDELVMLVSDGATSQHLVVMQPSGAAYGDPDPGLTWDSASAGVSFASERDGKPGIRLVAGDFDADLVDDLALVVSEDDPTLGSVYLLRSRRTSFEPLARIYAGGIDAPASRPYGADVTGDGRADVVLETDTGSALAYRVLRSTPDAGHALADPVTWYECTDLTRNTTQTVVTDYDRDGRDDLVLALPAGTGFAFRGLRATGSAFAASTLYTSGIAFDRIKLGAGDVNHDGRGDVIAYTRLYDGAFGTRLFVLTSTCTKFNASALWLEDPTLDWQVLEPY